mgnify:CR=1 FL=1
MTILFKRQIKNLIHKCLPPQLICRYEFNNQSFIGFNERPVEYSFKFRSHKSLYPKKVLDVGTGKTALPHLMSTCGCLVTAIDKKGNFNYEDFIYRCSRCILVRSCTYGKIFKKLWS